jgi:hypothetical protein
MTDVLSRLARIEEHGKYRDEILQEIRETQKATDEKIDKLTEVHIANMAAMKTHKMWMGGIAGVAGALAGFFVKYFPSGLPK